MTREEAYAELVARLDNDVNVKGYDYCVGEDRVRELLEAFKSNEPVEIKLTPEQAEAVDQALGRTA